MKKKTSEKHRRSIGETSEVAWRTDLNDTQQKIIKLLSEDYQLSAVKLAEKIVLAKQRIVITKEIVKHIFAIHYR